ncbi:MAG: hypothetical protein JNL67_16130 [Planctomycetaceae bacterium]|nr:hypothetical protein [Planctomycetaceae bacterium]
MSEDEKNDEMALSLKPRDRQTPGWNARRLASLAVSCVLFVSLLLLSRDFSNQRRDLQMEIAAKETRLTQLKRLQEQLESSRQTVAYDRQVITDFLRLCRDAKDLPSWTCDRILASNNGFENLCLYVPDGRHSLVITARWNFTDNPELNKSENTKTWRIPLLPKSGYWWQILSEQESESVGWVLTSNHPDFHTQTATLPVTGFDGSGMSQRSNNKVISYPNELEDAYQAIRNKAPHPDQGVEVFNLVLHGNSTLPVEANTGENPATSNTQQLATAIEFTSRIESEGPLVVPATDVDLFYILGSPFELNYLGDGKYAIEMRKAN